MKRLAVLAVTRVSRALAVSGVAALGVVTLASACASRASAVGPGGECFLATDCAPGLVCIEQPDRTRVCSDDLARVAGESPPEGGAGEDEDAASEGGADEASVPDSAPPPPDVNVPDTGPPDTGTPPVDAGSDG